MKIPSQVAEGMQAVLTKTADIIGSETGFIKRLRKLSGSRFVQILVFGWLNNPNSTVEELCQTAATLGIAHKVCISDSHHKHLTVYRGYWRQQYPR